MSQSSNQIAVEYGWAEHCPIEYLTENDFSIMRLSEIDESIPAVGTTLDSRFATPTDELEITVDIADGIAQTLASRSRGRLTADSFYWVCCISPSTCVSRKPIRRT
jgi:hypothetical protein